MRASQAFLYATTKFEELFQAEDAVVPVLEDIAARATLMSEARCRQQRDDVGILHPEHVQGAVVVLRAAVGMAGRARRHRFEKLDEPG